MTPWNELAALIAEALETAGKSANVYAVPPAVPVAPALAIRPGEPWAQASNPDEPFARLREVYEVAAIVSASDTASAVDELYALARIVDVAAQGRFAWVQTSAIVEMRSGELVYLGVTVTLTYSGEGV